MKSVTLLSQALNSVIERKRNETSRSEIKYFQGLFIQGKPAQLALLARFTRLTWPMPCFLIKFLFVYIKRQAGPAEIPVT